MHTVFCCIERVLYRCTLCFQQIMQVPCCIAWPQTYSWQHSDSLVTLAFYSFGVPQAVCGSHPHLYRGPCGYLVSECCTGSDSQHPACELLPCTLPLTLSTRLDRPQVPFFKYSVYDQAGNRTHNLPAFNACSITQHHAAGIDYMFKGSNFGMTLNGGYFATEVTILARKKIKETIHIKIDSVKIGVRVEDFFCG